MYQIYDKGGASQNDAHPEVQAIQRKISLKPADARGDLLVKKKQQKS